MQLAVEDPDIILKRKLGILTGISKRAFTKY
jgi:hypothetical protein